MGSSDDEAIDLSQLMPDLWPDLEHAIDAGVADAWLQVEDPLLRRRQGAARPIEEQDTLVRLPMPADNMMAPVQATPPTLILPATYRRQRLAQAGMWIACSVLLGLIALFLVADIWLLVAHFLLLR
jgi:hypothetical protein